MSEDSNIKEELQLREIHCKSIQDFKNRMEDFMNYKTCLTQCNDQEKVIYQKVFAQQGANKDNYILYVIQEKLQSIR